MRVYLVVALLAVSGRVAAQEASTSAQDAEISAAEEELMIAAATAAAEEHFNHNRMGGSLGVEGMNELTGARARGLGTSIAFTFKTDIPFEVVGQLGAIAWPSAFSLNAANEVPDKAPWEVFLAASLLPLTWGPVDFGIFLRLSAQRFFTGIADRAELGLAVQWQLDRTWALRYQAGCSIITNFLEPTLVSTLALDVAFPSFI